MNAEIRSLALGVHQFTPCLLPSLTDLDFYGDDALFDSLTLPALRSLTIEGDLSGDNLMAMVSRSAFPLETLSIINIPMDDTETWKQILSCLPKVSELNLEHWFSLNTEVPTAILQQLTLSPNHDRPMLPKLEIFSVRCSPEQLETIMTLIESRRAPGLASSLKKVNISVDDLIPRFPPGIQAKVKILAGSGLEINLD
ncbi:hypothetical protein C8J56DRAFT_1056765 [Mycena floridula]|nr:hypothetical protein C8J56DRAFT_1056765 [Mycena floridula]